MSKKYSYEATPANIENEYKKYARKGRPHKHWLDQFDQLSKENRLPKEWQYLTRVSRQDWFDDMLVSLDRVSKEFWNAEHSRVLKQAQKKFSESSKAAAASKSGGVRSGIARRLNRNERMIEIVEAYRTAMQLPPTVIPRARAVANWYAQREICNSDSLTRRLRDARVAE